MQSRVCACVFPPTSSSPSFSPPPFPLPFPLPFPYNTAQGHGVYIAITNIGFLSPSSLLISSFLPYLFRQVMEYIAAISGGKQRSAVAKDRILQSNPILEAFGNAKVRRRAVGGGGFV